MQEKSSLCTVYLQFVNTFTWCRAMFEFYITISCCSNNFRILSHITYSFSETSVIQNSLVRKKIVLHNQECYIMVFHIQYQPFGAANNVRL